VPLEEADIAPAPADESVDVLALDRALRDLKDSDPRMYDVTMLRHFAELSNEETARALGISERTVSREWGYAKLWLIRTMNEAAGEGDGPHA
jgi:DNA-directed RNA polymerase specialized sigma24 family protein